MVESSNDRVYTGLAEKAAARPDAKKLLLGMSANDRADLGIAALQSALELTGDSSLSAADATEYAITVQELVARLDARAAGITPEYAGHLRSPHVLRRVAEPVEVVARQVSGAQMGAKASDTLASDTLASAASPACADPVVATRPKDVISSTLAEQAAPSAERPAAVMIDVDDAPHFEASEDTNRGTARVEAYLAEYMASMLKLREERKLLGGHAESPHKQSARHANTRVLSNPVTSAIRQACQQAIGACSLSNGSKCCHSFCAALPTVAKLSTADRQPSSDFSLFSSGLEWDQMGPEPTPPSPRS